ncbi:conserved hypothetical protein [Talaromyces marneffei ATCC 18224]|uniref:CCHC-type domain-containing protein n=1 Tax=Talaromyces marneffei (strain ATCC 18224 / CBS 334.59 / QM 7333) TaxID=441960 RepID=B6QWI9_TALMQ|nr:conserved hypothetical protein [Talaromyces marneffei ATCC 18224]
MVYYSYLHVTLVDPESNTPTSQALDQLLKGALITMHNAAILTSENHKLREAVDQLQKRRTRRAQALPNEGILTVSEGRELAQALDQAHEAATVTNQPEPPQRAQRAPPRCSNCWELGHKRNRCPNTAR